MQIFKKVGDIMIDFTDVQNLVNTINFQNNNQNNINLNGVYLGTFSFEIENGNIKLSYFIGSNTFEKTGDINTVRFFLIKNIWRNYCINNSEDVIEFKSSKIITLKQNEVSHGNGIFKKLISKLQDKVETIESNLLTTIINALTQNKAQESTICELTDSWYKNIKLSINTIKDFNNSAISVQIPDGCNFVLTLSNSKSNVTAGSRMVYIFCNALFVTYNNNRVLDEATIKEIVNKKLNDNNLRIIVGCLTDGILGQEKEEEKKEEEKMVISIVNFLIKLRKRKNKYSIKKI